MHFALPPKRSALPPPYARTSPKIYLENRRKQLQILSYVVLGILTVLLLVRWLGASRTETDNGAIPEDSTVLIVTVTDEKSMSEDYIRIMKANREEYASRHGYQTYYADASAYTALTDPSPASWTLIPALRHALALHPDVDYVWSLTPNALIMNSSASLHSHIFSRLPSLMQKDIPVVPPDSVIHTFSHLKANQAYCIITQDIDNIAHTSFLLRNTANIVTSNGQTKDQWAAYFLDAWFDPLYRNYAFQKAENHALEHIVQWHPTVLAKLVVIEQRLLNSYDTQAPTLIDPDTSQPRTRDSMWQQGDLIVHFKGCHEGQRDCEREMRDYFYVWQQMTEDLDGKVIRVPLNVKNYVSPPAEAEGEAETESEAEAENEAEGG